MKKLLFLFSLVGIITLVGCKFDTSKNEKEPETVKREFVGELPELSIYNLPSDWTNQDGENIQLEDLRGDIIVAVMIYTSCQAACPRLIADMRLIHNGLSKEAQQQTKFVYVSIDPEVDTPEKMKEFAIENEMDNDRWVFLRGTEDDTRTFASVLGTMSYQRISPIDFSHSNIISVFDQNGVLYHQREGLEQDGTSIIEAVEELSL
ncbi:MAG: SCO family protein [Brumimicrobium sp.]